jgi:hypothetical protein
MTREEARAEMALRRQIEWLARTNDLPMPIVSKALERLIAKGLLTRVLKGSET